KRFINFVIGDRSANTGKALWNNIKDKKIDYFMTDHWRSYNTFLPKEKHIKSKEETFTVEGYNSLFRHFLARMRRKSKCYSKCVIMLEYSLRLLMLKWNNELSILG
ncbi:MAG: insertion element IS1 protein InsB, partial [Candidatus Deianiraeaceae bacterium]